MVHDLSCKEATYPTGYGVWMHWVQTPLSVVNFFKIFSGGHVRDKKYSVTCTFVVSLAEVRQAILTKAVPICQRDSLLYKHNASQEFLGLLHHLPHQLFQQLQ